MRNIVSVIMFEKMIIIQIKINLLIYSKYYLFRIYNTIYLRIIYSNIF